MDLENAMDVGAALVAAVGPVMVVNLEARTDRLRHVTIELARIGLTFDNVSMRRFPAIRPTDAGGFDSVGMRGCFLSHLGVLDVAVRENWPGVVIVEDDLDFVAGAEARLPMILKRLETLDWGIFHGGTVHPVHGKSLDDVAGLQVVVPAAELIQVHLIAFRGPVVRQLRDFLQEMLLREPGAPDGGPMDVDGAYHHFRMANPQVLTVLASPAIAVQRPSPADVRPRGRLDRIGFLAPILALARSIKRRAMRRG